MARRGSPPSDSRLLTGAIDPVMEGGSPPSPRVGAEGAIDRLIARLAEASHGVVRRRALIDEGLTSAAVDHRIRAGRLHVLHPGVYAVGHRAITTDARALAAVLTAPAPAGLAGAHAAAHWRMLSAPPGRIEVVHGGTHRYGPRGVRLRRTKHLDLTIHRGVPVTIPTRTLLDLAATGPPARLELALNEALATNLVTRAQIEALAASSRRGAPALKRLLSEAPGYTRREAERRLRSLILKAQFPKPQFNAVLLGAARDVLWPDHRLVIEIDGWATHGTRQAFESDRRRDAALLAAGYTTLRFTWRRLIEEPELVVAQIAAALARARG